MSGFIITGTDTDIGKTAVSAMLMGALRGTYFKPVQAGLEEETDTQTVRRLSGLSDNHFVEEGYRLTAPLSPHRAAELDALEIDAGRLCPEQTIPASAPKPWIVEGAGGLLVPLSRQKLLIDVFPSWRMPVILCARTGLGTINHTLLSIEALRSRNITIHGIIFVGDENPDNQRTISEMGTVKVLGRLPRLGQLTSDTLQQAYAKHFTHTDFVGLKA